MYAFQQLDPLSQARCSLLFGEFSLKLFFVVVCGVAVLLSHFVDGILVNKASHRGIVVISNSTVHDVCVFKATFSR